MIVFDYLVKKLLFRGNKMLKSDTDHIIYS